MCSTPPAIDHVVGAERDAAGTGGHRGQGPGAHPVDRVAGHRLGQAGEQRRGTPDGQALVAGLGGRGDGHVVDPLRRQRRGCGAAARGCTGSPCRRPASRRTCPSGRPCRTGCVRRRRRRRHAPDGRLAGRGGLTGHGGSCRCWMGLRLAMLLASNNDGQTRPGHAWAGGRRSGPVPGSGEHATAAARRVPAHQLLDLGPALGGRQSWRRVKSIQLLLQGAGADHRRAAPARARPGRCPASRSTSRASSAVGPSGRGWWCTASHIGARRVSGWVPVISTTTRSRACCGERGDEGHQVGDVVEHVRADDDVADRDLVGDVGPPPSYVVTGRRGYAAATSSAPASTAGSRPRAGDRRLAPGPGWPRPHPRRRPAGCLRRRRAAAGTPCSGVGLDVLTGGEQSGWEAVRRLRRSGQDLRVDRPSGQLVRPPSRCTICHHRAEVIQAR